MGSRAKQSYANPRVTILVRVALVPESYPGFKMKGEEDLVMVREAVAGEINNLPEEGANTPRFEDTYLSRGTVVAVCG